MTEEINDNVTESIPSELPPSGEKQAQQRFRAQLESLQEHLPEVASAFTALVEHGNAVIEQFEINEGLFDDPAKTLIFTAIVLRMINRSAVQPENPDSYEAFHIGLEGSYIHNQLAKLAFSFSPHFPEIADKIAQERKSNNPGALREIYDRFTDKELSAELKNRLKEITADTRERLGINDENEDPFDVRVLSIATGEVQTFGLHPEMPDYDNLPDDPEQRQKILDEAGSDRQAFLQWTKGLMERWQDLSVLIGMEYSNLHAWVTYDLDNVPTLLMPMPIALKMLYPDMMDKSGYYTDEHLEQDKKIVKHEYVHTQGGLAPDGLPLFGLSLEELRAEYYSGTGFYLDIQGFYQDLSTIVGEDMRAVFSEYPKGGTAAEVYLRLAAQVGLESMLEVLSLPPISYYNAELQRLKSRGLEPMMSEVGYLGGYDGVLERILVKKRQEDNFSAGFKDRIKQRAERFLAGNRDFLPTNLERRHQTGLNLVTRQIEDEIVRQEPSLDFILR